MQYLVAIHHTEDFEETVAMNDDAMMKDIDDLNDEMAAAGARFFAGGLQRSSLAKSLRAQPDGSVQVTDGLYLGTKDYVGGFWILDCSSMEEALEWGKKAVAACRAGVEVRQFHAMPG